MRNKQYFKYIELTPNSKDARTNCTSRCIAYCLGIPYEKVLTEQKTIAKHIGDDYRLSSIWDLPLIRKGWFNIRLDKKQMRYMVAKSLSKIEYPIATLSCGHVCPVHRGYVMDNKESQNQWVCNVVCKEKDVVKVKKLLLTCK